MVFILSTVFIRIIVLYMSTVKPFYKSVQYEHQNELEGLQMTFGKRLNETRKSKGVTAQAMADLLEIGLRSYRAYESDDREPSFAVLVKIADRLDVSTDCLLCRDEFLAKHAD